MNHGFIKTAAASPDLQVADCRYNAQQIIYAAQRAAERGVKLLTFPQLSITGASCADLFWDTTLQESALSALRHIQKNTAALDMLMVLGLPLVVNGKLYNSAAVIHKGVALGFCAQTSFSQSGSVDYSRWFSPAPSRHKEPSELSSQSSIRLSNQVFVCKDMPNFSFGILFEDELMANSFPAHSPMVHEANILVTLAASPEIPSTAAQRRKFLEVYSLTNHCAFLYANAGTGESTTDNVFAGHCAIVEDGCILDESPLFAAAIAISEVDVELLTKKKQKLQSSSIGTPLPCTEFFTAPQENALTRKIPALPFIPATSERKDYFETTLNILAHGLAKRIEHTHSSKLVLGISGGLDSTLALLVCVRALRIAERPSKDLLAITLPCFGTTSRSRSNAEQLSVRLGAHFQSINISESVTQHFIEIGHDKTNYSTVYENAQARMRTMVLMDVANSVNGLMIGTGDLSEIALGWSTYNGDHISMYAVNASIPKTLVRALVNHESEQMPHAAEILQDILDTPISPELLPTQNGQTAQHTEKVLGPYELHDFTLYHMYCHGFTPGKIALMAETAFDGQYSRKEILQCLSVFYKRFFASQFKRSCSPDGPAASPVSLSPRGSWCMPSDACSQVWLKEINDLEQAL